MLSFLHLKHFKPKLRVYLVHIRKAGDWTSRLIEKIATADGHTPAFKKISVDGPFGTSADNIFKYETVILIGK
jgi:hypothetical protein